MSLNRILEIDARLSTRIRVAEQPGLLRSIAGFLGHTGDSWFWLAGLILLFILGSSEWKIRAVILFASILALATVVMALKFSIRRRRPEGEWGQIYRKTDPHSFPSGHAARGILIGVIAFGLGPAWFGWLLIIWGPLVGLARVATGLHYLSDIAAGWVLGIGLGILALQAAFNFFPI
jgi:undecaprenyl-diphosphatase